MDDFKIRERLRDRRPRYSREIQPVWGGVSLFPVILLLAVDRCRCLAEVCQTAFESSLSTVSVATMIVKDSAITLDVSRMSFNDRASELAVRSMTSSVRPITSNDGSTTLNVARRKLN